MSKLPKIIFQPLESMRFTTLGDWWEDSAGDFTIAVTNMVDWQHSFLVLIHELTEWAICQARGVSTKACDAFDEEWERDIKAGLVSPKIEAGFNRRCPYREGHVWGARMERLFAFLLSVPWREYCRVCDNMMEMYHERSQ